MSTDIDGLDKNILLLRVFDAWKPNTSDAESTKQMEEIKVIFVASVIYDTFYIIILYLMYKHFGASILLFLLIWEMYLQKLIDIHLSWVFMRKFNELIWYQKINHWQLQATMTTILQIKHNFSFSKSNIFNKSLVLYF